MGWRSNLNSGRSGSAGRWGSDGSRSDAPSWQSSGDGDKQDGRGDDEVTSPLKAKEKMGLMKHNGGVCKEESRV